MCRLGPVPAVAPQGADSSINSQVPAKLVPHSSYLLASPTDGFAKAQLMSQCLPYHLTDLPPYLPYLPYQRLKPCSPCQALLTQSQIGSVSCREIVCQYVLLTVVAV